METERDTAAHALDADEGKTVTTSSCPHCGLEFGKGYAGIPLCRHPWGGAPEVALQDFYRMPTYPNCILKRTKGSSAEAALNEQEQEECAGGKCTHGFDANGGEHMTTCDKHASSAGERGKLTADAKSEATSDSTPAGAGPDRSPTAWVDQATQESVNQGIRKSVNHIPQTAGPDVPTPRTDAVIWAGGMNICRLPNEANLIDLACQLERELVATRASEGMYIERTQRAEYDLAKANTRVDAEVTFRRYYVNQLANERKARTDSDKRRVSLAIEFDAERKAREEAERERDDAMEAGNMWKKLAQDWAAAADAARQPDVFYVEYSEKPMRAMQALLTKERQRAEAAEHRAGDLHAKLRASESCAALAEVNLSKQEDAERREAQHLAAIEVWQREAQSAQADAAQMFEQTRERCVRELWELGIPEDAAPIKVLRALQPEPGQGEKL